MLSDPWLPWSTGSAASGVRLFCFPHAGGGASTFREWQQLLRPSIQACPVQLPGREGRLSDSPFTRMTALIDALVPVVRPYLDRPFAFFGHSMGGIISFELARRLRRDGLPQARQLFLAGCLGPDGRARWLDRDRHLLPRDELIAELERFAGTPPEAMQNRELMDVLLPTIRADFELVATATCTSEPPLDVPITAMGGVADEDVTPSELDAWGRETSREFRRHLFPGGHFFVSTARHQILTVVRRDLEAIASAMAVPGARG